MLISCYILALVRAVDVEVPSPTKVYCPDACPCTSVKDPPKRLVRARRADEQLAPERQSAEMVLQVYASSARSPTIPGRFRATYPSAHFQPATASANCSCPPKPD